MAYSNNSFNNPNTYNLPNQDHSKPPAYSNDTHQPSFPTELPPRHQPISNSQPRSRLRGCFSSFISSYSLRCRGVTLARRICMWLILGLRTAQSGLTSALWLIWPEFKSVGSAVVGIIFFVLGLLSVAWCLAIFDQAEGTRRVFGANITKNYFTYFIYALVPIHIGLLVGSFWEPLPQPGCTATWFIVWVLIALATVVAGRPAQYPSHGGNV
ncbi:hypothetical protein LTR78_004583 [Recurvomyces mirabilis]|uniref:Uncharacterized protein n=1 Tax=Recurvomyces mirabilis TaxID=574656 RepID=A0AAE0WPM8_9PEZI|nr:hypothetical protein LTR78_004583 [Recurvomyces mirabilis]KAK5152923.1 hypothetical protein LTS14_008031 [Recurvomyces mirabilis]